MKKRKKKRKINPQKIFCFISFIFILTCCLWYGGRCIYFYLDSKKTLKNEKIAFADILKRENHDKKTFVKDDTVYYFYQDGANNYLKYSNLLWRIVKINEDNSITLVSDDVVTNLAYGVEVSYDKSPVIQWLNTMSSSKYSGILESNLNHVSDYLVKSSVCTDKVDSIDTITCNDKNNNYYMGLLSVSDFVKTGGKKSFVLNKQSFYLANHNKDDEVWYVDGDGKLHTSEGDIILGVKPTITLSSNIVSKSGNGSKDNPYVIEEDTGYFASYVKLGNDIWRVYQADDKQLKLILNDYVKDNTGSNYKAIYSKQTYRHNDTINGSFAYYLNHTYYNSLSYKEYILNANYDNGYYGEENDFALKELYLGEIDTKVAIPHIGDVTFSHDLDGYFISTGLNKNSTSVYVFENGEVTSQKVTKEAYVIPCITINKDILKSGNGSKDTPYTV